MSLTEDYAYILRTGKMVEDDVLKIIRKAIGPDSPADSVVRILHIIPGAAIIDRYIEAVYVDGVEILTIQISGRMVGPVTVGYRE